MRSPLAAALLLTASTAFADIAPMPWAGAGQPQLMPDQDAAGIRMAREEIVIELYDGFAVVDGIFEMVNDGDKVKALSVGFPGEGVKVRGNLAHKPLIGFREWQDGKLNSIVGVKDVERSVKSGPPGREYSKHWNERWHVFSASFAPKKTTKLRVRYAVIAEPFKGDGWSSNEWFQDGTVSYVLATGARWSGAIGQIIVRVRARDGLALSSVRIRDGQMAPLAKREADAGVAPSLPPYARLTSDEVVIDRRDVEPTDDDNLEVVFPLKSARPDPRLARELWSPVDMRAQQAAGKGK